RIGITIATIKMTNPRMRNRLGAFDSLAAARRPKPNTILIAAATHMPVLSANNRVRSFARVGAKIMTAPIVAMTAHKINANAVMFGCVLFWHGGGLFGI